MGGSLRAVQGLTRANRRARGISSVSGRGASALLGPRPWTCSSASPGAGACGRQTVGPQPPWLRERIPGRSCTSALWVPKNLDRPPQGPALVVVSVTYRSAALARRTGRPHSTPASVRRERHRHRGVLACVCVQSPAPFPPQRLLPTVISPRCGLVEGRVRQGV